MALSRVGVDVGLWSLSIGAAAAGCGPLIPPAGDTDTDGDPDDDGDTDSPPGDTPWDTEDTIPHDTWDDCDACPPGFYCLDGACVPDGYDECDGLICCGYDCYDDECDAAEDCGAGAFCSHGYGYGTYCYGAPELGLCEAGDLLARAIALPPEAAGGALALAFADVDPAGGDELLVVQWNEATLVTGAGTTATAALPLPEAEADVWATTIPNDGGSAFVVSAPRAGGARRVTLEEGVLQAGPVAPVSLQRIAGGDFDGDGFGDVAGIADGTLVWLRGGEVELTEVVELRSPGDGVVAVGSFDGDGLSDIAFHEAGGWTSYITAVSDPGPTTELLNSRAVQQTVVAADLDVDGSDDIAGLTRNDGTMLLFAWRYTWTVPGFVARGPVWAPDLEPDAAGFYRVAAGDLDADGGEDLVIGGNDVLRIVFGDPTGFEGFRCYADVPIAHAASTLAVGDLDGDGRLDVAFSHGTTTTVLAQP